MELDAFPAYGNHVGRSALSFEQLLVLQSARALYCPVLWTLPTVDYPNARELPRCRPVCSVGNAP
jgi:hypothetical protein